MKVRDFLGAPDGIVLVEKHTLRIEFCNHRLGDPFRSRKYCTFLGRL
jgi:hypothetical protein